MALCLVVAVQLCCSESQLKDEKNWIISIFNINFRHIKVNVEIVSILKSTQGIKSLSTGTKITSNIKLLSSCIDSFITPFPRFFFISLIKSRLFFR